MILAGLLHIVVSVLLALGLGWVFGGLNSLLAFLSLAGGALAALRLRPCYQTLSPLVQFRKPDWIEGVLLVFLLLVGMRHFMWLLYETGDSLRTLSVNNLGDLPLHINYIRQLASGADIPPVNPEFSAQALYYPYALDLYNALWEAVGIPLTSHLFLTGMFLLLATLAALKNWAGWLGIIGFFLNGGWAGWQLLQNGEWQDYQGPMAWKNFFLALFITQRGLMFAIPVGLFVLSMLRSICSRDIDVDRHALWLTGFLWGGLAFFHLHSFVAVSLIIAGYAALFRTWRPLLQAALTAVPLGSFFVLYSTEFLQKASVMYLQWGWMAGNQPLALFWWSNLGPWLLLFLGSFLVLLRRRQWSQLSEFGLYLTLFVLFNWVMLAPWEWDNIKVLLWPYLGLLAIVWRQVPRVDSAGGAIWRRGAIELGKGLAAVVLGFSGAVSILSSLNPPQDSVAVYSTRALWSAEGAIDGVPPDAVFLASPTYNHPLTYWGRIRVLGYEGHTWSHGIDSSTVSETQAQIYRGNPDWRKKLEELGATHIVLGPEERMFYGEHELEWLQVLRNISQAKGYEVYLVD